MTKLIMKVSKTVIIDLDDCYLWQDRTAKEKHEIIENSINSPQNLLDDGDTEEDIEVLNWDIEE